MSFTETEKHWLWGCAAATAASRSDVNVAIPHLRGKWSPTKAILWTLEASFMGGLLGDSFGGNNESAWSRTDEIERVTSDQGQDLAIARSQHRDVVRVHHSRGHDAITILTLQSGDHDDV